VQVPAYGAKAWGRFSHQKIDVRKYIFLYILPHDGLVLVFSFKAIFDLYLFYY